MFCIYIHIYIYIYTVSSVFGYHTQRHDRFGGVQNNFDSLLINQTMLINLHLCIKPTQANKHISLQADPSFAVFSLTI